MLSINAITPAPIAVRVKTCLTTVLAVKHRYIKIVFIIKDKVKAHTSQRPKRPELIPVSLYEAYVGALLLPPGRDASLSQGYPPAVLYVTGNHLYTWVTRDKVE